MGGRAPSARGGRGDGAPLLAAHRSTGAGGRLTVAREFLPATLAVLAAVVVYFPSLSNGFAWDDVRDIRENERVHGVEALGSAFVTPYRTDVPAVRSPYRPLTSISFALNWHFGNGAPGPFHVTNLLLHATATALVAALLLALTFPGWTAGVGALVFAVHPIHTEAVANVVGRGDVLMTVFVLVGALAWLRRGWPAPLRAGVVLAAYAAALLTKENGIALPALLVALDVFMPDGPDPAAVASADADATATAGPSAPHGGGAPTLPLVLARLRAGAPLYVGLVGVAAGYLVLRWSVLGTLAQLDTAAYIVALSPVERFTTAVANLAEAARLLVWPAVLSADYGPAVILPAGLADARFWLGLLTGLAALVVAFTVGLRERWLGLGIAWAGLSFLIVSNLVIPVGIWLAERTLYLPSVGVSIVIAGALAAASTRRRQAVTEGALEDPAHPGSPALAALVTVVAVAVLAGGWRTWIRNADWADSDAVVARLAEDHPESYRAQWWLAGRLLEAGDTEASLRWYRSAVELNPNQALVVLDLVRALITAGEHGEAEARARAIPAALHPSRAVYLAQSLIEQGRTSEAADVVRDGLERFPSEPRLLGQAERLGIRD